MYSPRKSAANLGSLGLGVSQLVQSYGMYKIWCTGLTPKLLVGVCLASAASALFAMLLLIANSWWD